MYHITKRTLIISCLFMLIFFEFGQGELEQEYLSVILNSLSSNIPSSGVDYVNFVVQDGCLYDVDLAKLIRAIQDRKHMVTPQYKFAFQTLNRNFGNGKISCSDGEQCDEKGYNVVLPGNNEALVANLMLKEYEQSPQSIWLLQKTDEIVKALKNITTPIDSHIYLADTSEDKLDMDIIDLSEVYQIREDLPTCLIKLGNEKNVVQKNEDTIWFRRRDLQGITWKVGVKYAEPYTFKGKGDNIVSGFAFELWSLLAQNLNVSYEITVYEEYGKSTDGMNWNGIVGALQDGILDVSMSPIIFSLSRISAIDFLYPLGYVKYSLATFVSADQSQKHISIFDLVTTITIIILFVLSWLVSLVILRNIRSWNAEKGEVAVLSLGSFVAQGMDQTHLECLSQKVLFYTEFLCGILVLTFFSANLTSTLAVKETISTVKTLQDVYDQELNLYIPGDVCGGIIESDFRSAKDGIWHNIWRDQLSTDSKFTPERSKLIQNIYEDPKAVLFLNVALMLHHMKMDKRACRFHSQIIRKASFALPVKKGFTYKPIIDYQLEKLKESGVLDQVLNRYLTSVSSTRSYICSAIEPDHLTKITFNNVQGFFILISSGAAAGILVICLEYIHCKIRFSEAKQMLRYFFSKSLLI